MKTVNLLKIASLSATLAIAGPVFAFAVEANPPVAQDAVGSTNNDPLSDESGMAALGIDIRSAGSTPETVQAFVAALAPDVQTKVTGGCATINLNTSNVNASVATFCRALGG